MTEREKVIKGLECCSRTTAEPNCPDCPYNVNKLDCSNDMMHDAINLLKALELMKARGYVKPIKIEKSHGYWCECGWYLGDIGAVNYCANCGKTVIFE